MVNLRTAIAAGAFAAVIGISSGVAAQKADDAFQKVALLNAELSFLHQANLTEAPMDTQGQAVLDNRMPRHVLQKAREVFLLAQTLRENNGYGISDFPTYPVGETTPAEVVAVLDGILLDVGDLRDAYGVSEDAMAAAASGKSWSDVYHELNIAAASFVALGVPAADANTVFQIATTIVSDLKQIRAARGISGEVTIVAADTKTPGDVYAHGIDLLSQLQELAAGNSAYSVPGSIQSLALQTHDVHGVDVLDVMNNVLAEVVAMKAVLGVSEPTVLAARQAGQSPASVFDQISTAMGLLATLRDSDV